MEALGIHSSPLFEWLLKTTIQGSILICLILLVKMVLRQKLPVRWHYFLWLLLLMRLTLPWSPQSRISIFNLMPQYGSQQKIEAVKIIDESSDDIVQSEGGTSDTGQTETALGQMSNVEAVQSESLPASEPASETVTTGTDKIPPVIIQPIRSHTIGLMDILPLIWLAGALILAGYIFFRNIILWRAIKSERQVTGQDILELLEDCKMQMRIQTVVGVVVTDKVKSPALFGFVRPRLLLPQGLLEGLDLDELQYVFLHELAHLRRRDIYLGWVVSLLQVLHWFNPLIWFAFRRMRTDQELACDALALSTMSTEEPQKYGRTLVNLFERFTQVNYVPSIAGILEDKSQLERRIKMITKYKKSTYRWSPLAAILIIILGCVTLPDAISTKASQISAKKSTPPIVLRRVWSGPESPWQGKISPNGRYFSFVDGRDLAILELATGNVQRLTNIGDDSEKEYVFFSRWSPDSKQIVYEYNGDFSELRIIGLDGSEPRVLYREEEGGYVRPHDWSPDGKQVLAFLSREEINQIVLISVDDGAMRAIKTIRHGEYPYQWSFSPDGRHIVYESPQAEDSPESDIFLFSIDDKREVPIVEHLASDRILGWVPNSDLLLFVSNRTGSWDAWAISIAEGKPQGNPELIKKGIGGIYPMGFSQDGAFYYTDSKQMKDIYTVTINPETGKIDSPPNTLPVLGLGGNNNPQYSPDGKYLAYTRGLNLCIFSFETGKIRKFPPKFNARDVRWSPDSKYILFNSFDVNRLHRIYRLEVQTGNIIPILPPEEGHNVDYKYLLSFNEWSHDGKSFFYVETDRKNKLSRILNRDFETGNEKELYQGPKYFSISLSPDGQWLAFASRKVETEINIMPASGGESRELCKIVQPMNSPTPLVWTADGQYILFSTVQANSLRCNLWRVPKEGGTPQNLGLEMTELYNLTVHPDGRQIAFYSAGPSSEESEVWVMENFLPEDAENKR